MWPFESASVHEAVDEPHDIFGERKSSRSKRAVFVSNIKFKPYKMNQRSRVSESSE